MGTQVTKSCVLTFSQSACAVFYPCTSPPELRVHFPVLFRQEHLCAGDHCLCNVLGEVSYFPTANGCKCGPLKLWLTPDKAELPHPRALFRAGVFVLWYLRFVRASWQGQPCKAISVHLFLIKKVSLWPKRENSKLCLFIDTAVFECVEIFPECGLHPDHFLQTSRTILLTTCDQGAGTKVAVLMSGNFSLT